MGRAGRQGAEGSPSEGRRTGEVALVEVVARLAVEGPRLVVEVGQGAREQAGLARCGGLALHLDGVVRVSVRVKGLGLGGLCLGSERGLG